MDASEIWKPVEGYEGSYEVSDQGRVRSVDRIIEHPRAGTTRRRGKVLKHYRDGSGHHLVDLKRDGARWSIQVHRLVAIAFVPGYAPGLEVRHREGDPDRNAASDLVWGTHGENTLDSVRHGTHNQARKTACPAAHPYSTENTYVDRTGWRHCRTCRRERDRIRDRARVRSHN